MNMRLILKAAAMVLSVPAAAQSPAGDWYGTLGDGPGALRIVVHVTADEEADRSGNQGLNGTLDSPDQNAFGIPLGTIEVGNGALAFTVPLVSGEYQGTWDEHAQRWRGRWRQGSVVLPLELASEPAGTTTAAPALAGQLAGTDRPGAAGPYGRA